MLDEVKKAHDVVVDLGVNHVDLLDDVRVGRVEVAKEAEVLDGLLATSTGDQPTGRLLEEEGNTDSEESSGDELDCGGEAGSAKGASVRD